MELANSDSLRLNVLMAQGVKVIRIDEGKMVLYALTDKGEASIALQPTGNDEQYLRLVREFLSLKATGTSGGYPIFIRRWTRTGNKQQNIDALLLLGEHEAVVSAAHADHISEAQAEHIWWAAQSTEVAVQLLRHPDIIAAPLGQRLADFLIEFLPFEEVQLNVVNIISCCLQGDLLSHAAIEKLWLRGKRKQPIYVGFLYAEPDKIPLTTSPHPLHEELHALHLTHPDNPIIRDYLKLLSETGQKWLTALQLALAKPVDQDVVSATFIALEAYLHHPTLCDDEACPKRGERDIENALRQSQMAHLLSLNQPMLTEINHALSLPAQQGLTACLLLMQLGEDSLIRYFAGNDSVGSVMRKRLNPLLSRVDHAIQQLLA